MTKEVLISIKGLQYQGPGGEQGSAEMIVSGDYYEKNGRRFLIYDEPGEEPEDPATHTMMKIDEECVELTRKGYANVSMNFYKDRKNLCSYRMPFGNLTIGIDTEDIKLETPDDDTLKLDILYKLDINYTFYADCHMEIEVRSKAGGSAIFK